MANLANSFKFANKQLDIGIREFNNMINNDVLTIAKDLQNSILGFNLGSLGTLGSLTGQITNMINMVTNLGPQIIDDIRNSIDRTLNDLLNLPISIYGATTLATLKELDDVGVKDFLRESLDVGSMRYCDNLDLLQNLFDGIKLPESILDGLLLGLSLDWLNRICKGVSSEAERNMTNKQRLEVSHPYAGTPVQPDNLINDFGSLLSAYNYYSEDVPQIDYEQDKFFEILHEGKFNEFYDENVNFSSPTSKTRMLDDIEAYNKLAKKNNIEYPQYLEDRGKVRNMPAYGQEYVLRRSNLPRSKDALGSYIKNMKDVQVTSFNSYQFNELETSIMTKLGLVQAMAWKPEFISRSHASGQYQNMDFDPLLSIFTEEEIDYFNKMERNPHSWRFNGLPIVTEMFLMDGQPTAKKKNHVAPNPKHTPLDGKAPPVDLIIA